MQNLTNKILALIPKDKKNHFISASVVYYLLHVLGLLFFDLITAKIIATVLVVGYAICKEIYKDWIRKKGKAEVLDALASSVTPIFDWLIFLI
tara:strand:+ start:14772 stop:15050 length:279 start_codon:yes stop_codon:yes gene_type:complete